MHSKTPEVALVDIANNTALAKQFIQGFSFTEFQADRRTVYAIVRCLEIISEASRRLPPELKARHPQIDWAEIAAAGNIYRHAYQLVREETIWSTVRESLAPLESVVALEIKQLRDAR